MEKEYKYNHKPIIDIVFGKLKMYLSNNAKHISSDTILTGSIYHYRLSTVQIRKIGNEISGEILLNVVSDDDSKEREVFGELEKVLLGRK